jgi:hypothetical protein
MGIVVNPGNKLYKIPVSESKNKTTTDFETRPADRYSIELVAGSAVTDLFFNDHEFQKSWDRLFESCTWATVFQSRQFIAAWYRVYGEKHVPILIKAVERGQLKGVLPMALLQGGRITGAGHYDAEYQTWLAAPSDVEIFIKKALTELMKQFPGHPISFRFLPPETPLDWIKDDKKWRRCSIVQSYTRPLRNLRDPEHEKIFRSKHFKRKFNRLNRLGEVHFECIRDLESFESSLNEMAVMFDFRQSALFNKKHFKEEPEKKEFLLELFRLQLLHTTVMKIDGKIMAALVAIAGKDWIHVAGINCHSPLNARWYSPGFLHFMLVLKQLSEEQIQYFDLTPGYDAYKEEFANQHDEVKELVLSSELPFRIKKQIRKWIHARLLAVGIRPMTAELKLKKLVYLVRHRRVMSVIKRQVNGVHKKSKQKLFLIHTYTLKSAKNISLHKDSLNDLLEFEYSKGTDITRWEFLDDAMYRLEKGQHCFTWIETGRLLCCAWISYPDTFSAEKNNNHAAEIDIVLESVYCHSSVKDQFPSFLNNVVIDIAVTQERNSIYILADEKLF